VTVSQLGVAPFTTTLCMLPSNQFITQNGMKLYLRIGQLVQKDAVRDSIEGFSEIQKDYIHWLPFVNWS